MSLAIPAIRAAVLGQRLDADAAAYLGAVETADGQPLEKATRNAVNAFVVGCKTDGIWNAIKASCILAGARTLSGALVPLVGTAPTNVNGAFGSGDYNRKTGLIADGSTKCLDSNRNNNADPVDNVHVSIFITTTPTLSSRSMLDAGGTATGATNIYTAALPTYGSRLRSTFANRTASAGATGLYGLSRSSSASYISRFQGANLTITTVSQTAANANIKIFGDLGTTSTNARLSFYSIGESLDLALLDARVTALMAALAASIP